jgi:hypothetical protein
VGEDIVLDQLLPEKLLSGERKTQCNMNDLLMPMIHLPFFVSQRLPGRNPGSPTDFSVFTSSLASSR